MNTDRRTAVAALTAAGLLWGTTVPLSKVALEWLPPGWLALVRFTVAAAVLLGVARFRVRAACRPAVLATGALGYGGTVLVQNLAITRTSVSHAALLIGAAPVMVAIIAAVWHRSVARPAAWAGFAVSLAGVGLIAGGGGGGATLGGDGLVLLSVLLSAGFTVSQARLLRGQDPVAVTAVQFAAAALVALPVALVSGGVSAAPSTGTMLATAGLALGGTVLPFTLFAFGQRALPAEMAGAFLNLEPLVGAVAGVAVFGDPLGAAQFMGGAAIVGGIGLSTMRLPWRRRRPAVAPAPAVSTRAVPALRSAAPGRAAFESAAPGRAAGQSAPWASAGPGSRAPGASAPGTAGVQHPSRSGWAGRRTAAGHRAGHRPGPPGEAFAGVPGPGRPAAHGLSAWEIAAARPARSPPAELIHRQLRSGPSYGLCRIRFGWRGTRYRCRAGWAGRAGGPLGWGGLLAGLAGSGFRQVARAARAAWVRFPVVIALNRLCTVR